MWTKLTFLLLGTIVNVNSLVNSSNTPNANEGIINCKELSSIVGDFDFNCPVLDEIVHFKKDSKLFFLECTGYVKFQFAIFPKLNLYEVSIITLERCTVEKNINFGSLLEHFGINNTLTFNIIDMKGSLHLLALSEGFERLENLRLLSTVIIDLDENVFQGLEKLRTLAMHRNKITDLPENIFASLTNLQYLVLMNNEIDILHEGLFMHQRELQFLYLSDNGISNLPENIFANLTNLEEVFLSNNKIQILHERLFMHQKKLERLQLDGNEISNLPENIFANLTNLEWLRLSNNKIQILHERLFMHQKKLERLYLNGNEISNLPENIFANLTNLEWLLLSNNKIQILHERLFMHQRELQFLYLNGNEISNLPENIFAKLTNLEWLWLSNNTIQILHERLFMHQRELQFLHLDGNEISNLPENIFANLTNLKWLLLSNNKIQILHKRLFTHQLNIKYLRCENFKISESAKYMTSEKLKNLLLDHFSEHPIFSDNRNYLNYLNNLRKNNWPNMSLRRVKILDGIVFPPMVIIEIRECEFEYSVTNNTALLPTGKRVHSPSGLIFANQKKLQRLYLSQNELTDLSDKLFNGLNELHLLDLSYNNLTSINGLIFRELRNLMMLSLEHNHIKSIHSDAFEYTTTLMVLDLSYNEFQYFDTKLFTYNDKFLYLNLSNNYLPTFPSGWKDLHTLCLLDLGFNNISSYKYNDVHTTKNKIYYKEYYQLSRDELLDKHDKNDWFLSIFLNDNSLSCDCIMYRFLLVRKTGLNEFVNQLSEICGDRCYKTIASIWACDYVNCKCNTNLENTVEIRCENEWNLSGSPPRWANRMISNKPIELYINNNSYTELPNLHNDFVITIQASYNRIKDLKLENIPPNLRFLDVSHNRIKTISADVIHALHNHKLEAFLIVDTPWQCECSANTDKFIQLFTEIITDFQETTCRLPSGDIKLPSLRDYCETQTLNTLNTILIVLAVILVIIVSLVCLLVVLFYKYKKVTKIWLYTHNTCLCCIGEDEFDKDKKFDAFISYAFHDENVAVSILNELESGDQRFKICIHQRDFVPGRLIHDSIAEHMDDSCRTIVILSKNFLRSVWGQREFRRAYETGLAERRMRLIIVINGDIGNIERLEPTMRSYLKTHTYIEWGDPWFWQKMRYALPHRNRNTRLSQKHIAPKNNIQDTVL